MGPSLGSLLPPGPEAATATRALAFEIRLREGRRVLVRPLIPEDARRIQEGMTRMGWQSRLLRFQRRLSRLSREQVHSLAGVDQRSHVAWGALSLDEAGCPAVGVARYVVDSDDPRTARAVVTVVDGHQGLGLGTALLGMLRTTAQENGVTRLVSHILPENTAGRRLVARAGGIETGRTQTGLITVEIRQDELRPLP